MFGREIRRKLAALYEQNAKGIQNRDIDFEPTPIYLEVLNRNGGSAVYINDDNDLFPYMQRLYDEYDPLGPPLRKGIALLIPGRPGHQVAVDLSGDVRGIATLLIDSLGENDSTISNPA